MVSLPIMFIGRLYGCHPCLPLHAFVQSFSSSLCMVHVHKKAGGNPHITGQSPKIFPVIVLICCELFKLCHSYLHLRVITGTVGYRLKSQLKRYWATELWQTLFDTLLQPSDPAVSPPYKWLLDVFQTHLCSHPASANKLRAELIKQDCM